MKGITKVVADIEGLGWDVEVMTKVSKTKGSFLVTATRLGQSDLHAGSFDLPSDEIEETLLDALITMLNILKGVQANAKDTGTTAIH